MKEGIQEAVPEEELPHKSPQGFRSFRFISTEKRERKEKYINNYLTLVH